MSDEEPEVPEIIRNPPEKYDRIQNEPGVCGLKPNLYYDDSIHRLWVRHAVIGVENCGGIDEYVKMYRHEASAEEMRKAVEQALKFHEEYPEEFAVMEKRTQIAIEKLQERAVNVEE